MESGYTKTALKMLLVIGIIGFIINLFIFIVSGDPDLFSLCLVAEIIALPLIYLFGLFLKWLFEWLMK